MLQELAKVLREAFERHSEELASFAEKREHLARRSASER